MFGGKMLVAIDFDYTIWDPATRSPLPFAREAINLLRENGCRVIIHSCNNKEWIEKCLNNADIRFDSIWDQVGKPVADLYIDDCGLRFTGNWQLTLVQVEELLRFSSNPMIVRDK